VWSKSREMQEGRLVTEYQLVGSMLENCWFSSVIAVIGQMYYKCLKHKIVRIAVSDDMCLYIMFTTLH